MRRRHVVVVGTGEAGVTLTPILHRLAERGLVDRAAEVLSGAGTAANVDHASGCEYPKPGRRQAGADCIHGGLAKRLLFDLAPRLGHDPDRFGVALTPDELADHPHVVGGCRSAGGSVWMARGYAIERDYQRRLDLPSLAGSGERPGLCSARS